MSSPRFIIKKGDLDLPLRATLLVDGSAFSLTGYSVFFTFAKGESTQVFRRAAVVEDAAAGLVRYDWQAGDTDTVGDYRGEFEAVADATSKGRTFPSSGYIPIRIEEDLAN